MPSGPHSSGFCRAGAKRTVSSVRPATSKERVRRSADLVALQEKRAQTHKPSQRATVGARNAPTQAGEAQRPLQHARADQQQSRSRSRDRQIKPGAQPPTQQSRARQQQARASLVEKLENGAQQPQWNKARASCFVCGIFRPMISQNTIFTKFRVLRFSWNAISCYIGFLRGFYWQQHSFDLEGASNRYACYPAQLFVAVQTGIPGTTPWHLNQVVQSTHVSFAEIITHG